MFGINNTADPKTVWENDVRPIAVDIRNTCTTDPNLTKTLETLIKYVDSDIHYGKDCSDRLAPIVNVLNSTSYFKDVHHSTPEAELTKIRTLVEPINLLFKIARNALNGKKPEEDAKAKQERIPNTEVDRVSLYAPVDFNKRIRDRN